MKLNDPVAFAANIILWALVFSFFGAHMIKAGLWYVLR